VRLEGQVGQSYQRGQWVQERQAGQEYQDSQEALVGQGRREDMREDRVRGMEVDKVKDNMVDRTLSYY
jgi:hypothetical protein